MRMNLLGTTYNNFIIKHNYHKAVEIAKQRIRFVNKFCSNAYMYGAALVGIAYLYTNIGKKEEVEKLFKSSDDILNEAPSLRERLLIWMQKSEYYLFVEDTNNAELYCQKVLDCLENRKVAKSSDIFLSRALLQKALIQGLKGNYQAFIAESSTAKKAFQNLIGKRFRDNLGKKLFLALSVKEFLFLFTIMLWLLAFVFPLLRTKEFINFIVAFAIISLSIIYPLLDKIVKSNDDKMQSICQYFTLIQQEGKFYEYLGDYDLARERYDEASQGLSTFYQDLAKSLNKEYAITKELILAKSFVYLGSLAITMVLLNKE
jgi:tetratricopeptide (TPR) repeat protein